MKNSIPTLITLALLLIAAPSYAIDDKAMVTVPAGPYTMGCSQEGGYMMCMEDTPPHTVEVDTFEIDKYEVTYRRYKECIADGTCTEPFVGGACNWGFEWNDNYPVNCVDWEQAKTFCEWDGGKRLPTEAEWEKAARGTDNRAFPWGDEPASCETTVMDENGPALPMPGCGSGKTMPVGSKPKGASPYGAMDMAGNLWEWTADWYSENYYANSPRKNPQGPSSGSFKTIRGGAWTMRTDPGLASTLRFAYAPQGQGYVIGFRCVRSKNK